MNKKTIYILITICGLTWLLTSCAGTPAEPVTLEPTNTPLSSSSPVPPTETAAPTQTATPEPNETPLPTATSTQTPVPSPTYTPTAIYLGELSDIEFSTLMDIAFSHFQDGLFEKEALLLTEMLSYSMKPEQIAHVYGMRADDYRRLGDYNAGIADSIKAVEAGAEDPAVFKNLCWQLAITERPESVLPYCEKAVQLDPSLANLDSRGIVYALLSNEPSPSANDYREAAIEDFNALVSSLENATSQEDQAFRAERQKWVEILEAGNNPITEEMLVKFREETFPPVTLTTATASPQKIVTVPDVQKSMEELGVVFEEATTPDGMPYMLGTGIDGSCIGFFSLVGTDRLDMAIMFLDGCNDGEEINRSYWFLDKLLKDPKEQAKASVWMVSEVHHVIVGDQESTGAIQIGDKTLTASLRPEDQTMFIIEIDLSGP